MNGFIVHCPEDPGYVAPGEGLGAVLLERLKKHGDKPFQIDSITGNSQSFKDVHLKSIRVAQHLQSRGIKTTDIITLCSYNNFDSCIPLLSCLYLGIKVCSLDACLPLEDCVHLLKLVIPKFIFCDHDSLNLMEMALEAAGLKSEIVVYGDTEIHTPFSDFLISTNAEDAFQLTKVDINDTAIIFFSSGTTGLPKGVCCTHYGLLSKYPVDMDNPIWLFWSTLNTNLYFTTFYWISAVLNFVKMVLNGFTQILCKTFEVQRTLELIEQYKISYISLTFFQAHNLLTCQNIQKYNLTSLKCVVVGGSVLRKQQHKELKMLLPNVLVLNGYGLSETHGAVCVLNNPIDFEMSQRKLSSVGKVFQGFSVKVVDPETEKIVGPNIRGEIRVKGKSMFKGYYKDPKSTLEAFDEEGFLRTGDLGYYDEDKSFYIEDRLKEIFKYRKWFIVPTQLESVLMTHPDVKEAAVIGVPHEEDGERPMGLVVLKQGSSSIDDEILAFFNDRVSDPKKLRAGLRIVDSLPYTPTGKLKRRYLRDTVNQEKQ